MKRTWLMTALVLVVATAWLVGGCSDKATTSANLTQLDTTSANTVADNVSQPVMDMAGQDAQNVLTLINTIPAAGAPRPSLASVASGDISYDSVNYTYENGWHIFYYAYNSVDTEYSNDSAIVRNLEVHGWDSARIWSDGVPLQFRGTADSLESRGHGWAVATDSRENEIDGARHAVLKIDGDPWANPVTSLTFNGISHDTVMATYHPQLDATCTLNNSYVGVVHDVVADSAAIYGDGCMESGFMSWAAKVSLACENSTDSVSINGNWSIMVNFHGETQTKSFSNGLAQAVETDTCGSQPVMASARLRH